MLLVEILQVEVGVTNRSRRRSEVVVVVAVAVIVVAAIAVIAVAIVAAVAVAVVALVVVK